MELIFDNNPNLNDYKVDISMLNEEEENSQYLNGMVPENEDSDNNDKYININEFYPKKLKKSGKRKYI